MGRQVVNIDQNELCYWEMVQSNASHVLKHYRGDEGGKPPLAETFIPPNTYWTSDEKHKLFHHLKRFSRLRLDLVADAMRTKTTAEVSAYVGHLDSIIHKKSYKYRRKKYPPPAAVEMSHNWIKFEEHMSYLTLQREALTEHIDIALERRQACKDADVKVEYCGVGAVAAEYSVLKKRKRKAEENQGLPNKKRALDLSWLRQDLFKELDDIRLEVLDNMLDAYYESVPTTSIFTSATASTPYDDSDEKDDDGPAEVSPEPTPLLSGADLDPEGSPGVAEQDAQQSADRESEAPDDEVHVKGTVGRSDRIAVIEQLAKEANFTAKDMVQDEIDIFFLSRLGGLLCIYMSIPTPSTDFPLPRWHNPNYLTPPDKPTISYSTLKQLSDNLRQFLRMILQRAIIIAEADCEFRVHRLQYNTITEDHIRRSLAIFTGKESLLPRRNFIRTLPARLNVTLVNRDGLPMPASSAQYFPKPELSVSPPEPKHVLDHGMEIAGPFLSTPIAYRRPNWAPEFEGRQYEDEEDEYLRKSLKVNENYDNIESPLLPREPESDEDEELRRELLEEEELDTKDTVMDLLYEHQLWEVYDAEGWRFASHVHDSSSGGGSRSGENEQDNIDPGVVRVEVGDGAEP